MTFDEYSKAALSTAVYPNVGSNPIYPTLGLCGEAGEVAEKVKKMIRDGRSRAEVREAIEKELGDVLWYVNALAREFDLRLDYIAIHNLDKLASRAKRDKLHGEGDNR